MAMEEEEDDDEGEGEGEGEGGIEAEWRCRGWSITRRRSWARWTEREMTILIAVMKRKSSYSRSLELCRENGIWRDWKDIRQQWHALKRRYDRIRAWELSTGTSYYGTSLYQRMNHALPLCFNKRLYDQLAERLCKVLGNGRRRYSRRREERKGDGQELDRPVPLAVLEPHEQPPLMLLPNLEREQQACEYGDEERSLPELVCAGNDEAMDDNLAFADGCLRFEDDNVANGFLKLQGIEQAASGDFSKKLTPLRTEADRKFVEKTRSLQACRSRLQELSKPVKREVVDEDELKLVEEKSREALEASWCYQKQSGRYWNQQVQIDRRRLELLMKADAAFLVAINQLALAVQRLAEKLC